MDMTEIFIKIVNMSLTAGYCIIAVIVLRFFLRKQPKVLSYLLWSVVLFRLLCPFSAVSGYSLLRMDTTVLSQENFSGAGGTGDTVWHGKGYLFDETAQETAMTAVPAAGSEALGTKGEEKEQWWRFTFFVGAWVWLAGIVMLSGYSLWSAFRLRGFLLRAVLQEGNVYEAEGISTPFVFGIIRPRIYLPSHLQPEERRYVLEHEKIHVARKDYLVKLISWGAVCLHWFNPLVWIAFVLMERDMEMSCDEAVIRRIGADEKQAYSLALLQLSSGDGGLKSVPVAFGEGNVKGRIQNVLQWHRRRIVTVVSLVLLLGILAVGLALNPPGRTEREAEEMLRLGFVDAYASAYCDRDGNTLVSLYKDEETAYKYVMLLDKIGETYSFGLSSPWPNEFRFMVQDGGRPGEGKAQIWYYAWTSDPHVYVWKEEMSFTDYHVTESAIKYLDNISSKEEFEEAYLIDGEYQFTDYVERGFLEGINEQTAYDRENGGADRNAAYRSPETAAAWIFNLTGGQGEMLSSVSGEFSTVKYTFADGSSVEIPMYNVNYDNTTDVSNETDVEAGTNEEVWFPDLRAWSVNMISLYF